MDEEVKERVSTLEAVLGEFIVQTNKSLRRMEEDTKTLKEEMRGFKDEMAEFREEMRLDREHRDEEMSRFKEEMRQDRKDLNKKWGELANRLGTVAEDISAPNMKTIALQYFECDEIDTFSLQVSRRNRNNRKQIQEFDVVLTCKEYLFINETKLSPKIEHAQQFSDKLLQVFEYLPEHEGKTVVPVFSSLNIPDKVVDELTKHSIYAMSMGGETMELLNYEALQNR